METCKRCNGTGSIVKREERIATPVYVGGKIVEYIYTTGKPESYVCGTCRGRGFIFPNGLGGCL